MDEAGRSALLQAAQAIARTDSLDGLLDLLQPAGCALLQTGRLDIRLSAGAEGVAGGEGEDLTALLAELHSCQQGTPEDVNEPRRAAFRAARLPIPEEPWLTQGIVGREGATLGVLLATQPRAGSFSDQDVAAAAWFAAVAATAISSFLALRAARQAARARDELVAAVSHDLRNPLNTISLALTVLECSPEVSQHSSVLAKIRRGVVRMTRIMDELLDVTRIEAGTLTIEPVPIAPEELLDEVVELLGVQAAEKQVRLTLEVGRGVPRVLADHDRIMRVLLNLVGNAIKFTSGDGIVSLAASKHGKGVRFEVRDTGPGIAANDLPHVFDRFWQAAPAGKLGTGLGLFISKAIVEAHGSRIEAESVPGLGSTFSFWLPFVEPD